MKIIIRMGSGLHLFYSWDRVYAFMDMCPEWLYGIKDIEIFPYKLSKIYELS